MTDYEINIWKRYWQNVNMGNYNSLNKHESSIIRGMHERLLCSAYPWYTNGGLVSPICLKSGIPLLSGYDRMVIGDHGPYIEFSKKHLLLPIELKHGEEWRTRDSYNVKYHWFAPVVSTTQIEHVKIYYQVETVEYADYRIGKYYVSPFEISDSTITSP